MESQRRLDGSENKKLSWCWQTRATCLEIRGHQTWYHSIC